MHLRTTMSSIALALSAAALFAPGGFCQARTLPAVPAPAAQTQPPATPQAAPAPAAPAPGQPARPTLNPEHPFPPTSPLNFTAATPTKETVNEFLHQTWGYDPNRIWQVQAILKTPVEGVSKVIVLVSEEGQKKQQVGRLIFFTLPDGNHLISNNVLPFGPKPFQQYRQILETEATGPSTGSASKELEFVEFADFECPHCKAVQPTIKRLLADYPTAHFVYQNFPLVEIHPEAYKAAAYGTCVAKLSGNAAFFKFSDAVFENQDGLTPESAEKTLDAAATTAGANAAKVAACSTEPATKQAIESSIQLGQKVNVNGTPTLFINGFGIAVDGVPYPVLQKIIAFRAKEDGVNLPPPPLHLTTP